MHLAQAFYRERGPGGRSIVWGGYSGRGALVFKVGIVLLCRRGASARPDSQGSLGNFLA